MARCKHRHAARGSVRREDLFDVVRTNAHDNNEKVLAHLARQIERDYPDLPEEVRAALLREARATVYALTDQELTRFKARIAIDDASVH